MKHCQYCDAQFTPATSYQIYCSVGCRELATKEKIALRYEQTRRERRKTKIRNCKICDTTLSIYNDDPTCESCIIVPKEVSKILRQIKGMANGKFILDDKPATEDLGD
jgi:hypothetical protein